MKKIGSKTLAEWEKTSQSIGDLTEQNIAGLNETGVFYIKNKKDRKIYYIGRATEYDNGGLRKRLNDFIRLSDSARDHYAGKQIHNNINDIEVEIIKTGTTQSSAQVAKDLRDELIKRYHPIWNK